MGSLSAYPAAKLTPPPVTIPPGRQVAVEEVESLNFPVPVFASNLTVGPSLLSQPLEPAGP